MADLVYMARSAWTALLDSIRAKGGTSALMTAAQAKAAVEAIETGGGGTSVNDVLSDMAKKELTGDIVLDPSVTKVFPSYFFSEQKITSFSAAGWTDLRSSYLFQKCTELERVSLPNIENLYAAQCFAGCTSLKMACFPKLGTNPRGTPYFYNGTFYGCTSLEIADLNLLGNDSYGKGLTATEFFGCTSLKTLILRKTDGICPLGNINVFQNTPFASGGTGGTLYVPQALISAYQSATNWSTILGYANNQILPIEGSIYETQYADGTPVA